MRHEQSSRAQRDGEQGRFSKFHYSQDPEDAAPTGRTGGDLSGPQAAANKVVSEELRVPDHLADKVAKHGEHCARTMTAVTPTGDLEKVTPAKTPSSVQRQDAPYTMSLNFSSYREGIFGAFDARNIDRL